MRVMPFISIVLPSCHLFERYLFFSLPSASFQKKKNTFLNPIGLLFFFFFVFISLVSTFALSVQPR